MKISKGKRLAIDSRSVLCPSCSAPAGKKCYGTVEVDHYGRHRLALKVARRAESKMSDAR